MNLRNKHILNYITYMLFVIFFSGKLNAQKVEIGKSFKGTASYYHKKFSGRKTASGERLNNSDFTCAHKYFPFGTMIEVENPGTKIWVVVRVNDRGPFSKNRVLDLTYEAAKKLGMVSKGVIRINAKVVGKDGEILLFREGSTEHNFQQIFPKDSLKVVIPYLPETSASKKNN
jgi:rare lipoprotein A